MRILVATADGQDRLFVPRRPSDVQRLLTLLEELSAEEVAGGGLPPLYLSGVRYQREPRNARAECWQTPAITAALGTGDCEDLAAYRSSELRVSGEDPGASAEIVRTGARQLHAIVRRGDGSIEDPSAVLGMRVPNGRRPVALRLRETPVGYACGLIVPAGREHDVQAFNVGATGAEALGNALDSLIPYAQGAPTVAPRDWDIGFDPLTGAALDAAMPYIEKALDAAKSWLFGSSYDAYTNFANAVARSDAHVEPGANAAETIAKCLVTGIVPIYCSDSEGTRNEIFDAFKSKGWNGKKWSNAYDAGLGRKTWWYGLIYKVSDAPAAIVGRAKERAGTDYQTAMNRTMALCTDAKHQMAAYGGDENFDRMILDAVPVLPPGQAASTPLANALSTPTSSSQTPTINAASSDQLAALEQIVTPGRAGDWLALARMARVLQREGRRGPFGSMAQALLRMR